MNEGFEHIDLEKKVHEKVHDNLTLDIVLHIISAVTLTMQAHRVGLLE